MVFITNEIRWQYYDVNFIQVYFLPPDENPP